MDQVGQFIQTNQAWAGPIIFLLTLGESMLIIGILIPATALLLLTGGLVGSGTLPMTPILLWGIAGAIVGDAVSYWIGKWVGPSVLRWGLLKKHRTTVARARLFFYRYGFLSVLLGRFLGPIRSTVPTVAGVMGMSHLSFQVANTLSAIAWVPIMLAPGYMAAKSVEAAKQSSELTMMVGGGLSVVIGVGLLYFFMRQRKTAGDRPNRRNRSR